MPLKPKTPPREPTDGSNADEDKSELAYFFPGDLERSEAEVYPWLRDGYDSNKEDKLCSRCSRIDFLYLISQPTQHDICLGTVAETRKRDCAFCTLIFSTIRNDGQISRNEVIEGKDEVFMSSSSVSMKDFGWRWSRDPSRQEATYIGVHLSVMRYGGFCWSLSDVLPFDKGIAEDGNDLVIPRTVPSEYDPALLRGWLTDCASHDQFFPEPELVEFVDRFIDCEEYRVVNVQDRFSVREGNAWPINFAALSYVWGKAGQQTTLTQQTSKALFEVGRLSPDNQSISKTIQDAIQVCRDLSVRYLWVDALCIYQDDNGPAKVKQINNLHRIYENAAFTIIAAEGDHADRGLSGLSHISKHGRQPSVTAQGRRMILKPVKLEKVFGRLMWATRAWTFQEFLLSQRTLIFTDVGVYFTCPHGVRCEAVTDPPHAYGLEYKWQHLADNGLMYQKRNKLNWKVYAELATSYTKKLLTKESDRIPAFLAMSEAMRRDLFLATPFIWGLPVTELDAALLWRRCLGCIECTNTTAGLERVAEAGPSWSWAGWKGHVHYSHYILGNDNPALSTIGVAGFKEAVELASGAVVYSTETGPSASAEQINEQLMGRLRIGTDSAGAPTRPDNPTNPLSHWVEQGGSYRSPRGDRMMRYTHPFDEQKLSSRNWLVKNRGLLLDTEVASFAVVNRLFGDLKMQEFHPHLYTGKALYIGQSVGNPLAIYDLKTGKHCGALFDDFDFELPRPRGLGSKLPVAATFIKLSASVLSPNEKPAYQGLSIDNFAEIRDLMERLRRNPANSEPDSIRQHFSYEDYDSTRRWCMYNVLMVAWVGEGQVAHRLGIGKIHVDAFDHAPDLKRKTFILF